MSLVLAADYRVPERPPLDALLRSPVMFSWFDSAGVEEIPPMFAGEVVEKLDLAPEAPETSPAGQPTRLRDSVRAAAARIAASGARRFWIYRALDDQAEVMILLQLATERQAEQWVRHPDAAAARKPDRLRRRWGRASSRDRP